jgi:hypothetical protein
LNLGFRIWDGKNSYLGSGIQDKHPGSATLEILLPNLLEPNNNEIFGEKAFWGETKSFLQSKAASVALKRGKKTPVNWIFNLQQDNAAVAELRPQGKTVTATYLHKALAKI